MSAPRDLSEDAKPLSSSIIADLKKNLIIKIITDSNSF